MNSPSRPGRGYVSASHAAVLRTVPLEVLNSRVTLARSAAPPATRTSSRSIVAPAAVT
ncbi:hypothetical protein [Streptomyces sp. NPDC002276]